MSILSHRIYGNGPTCIYILHGIFGMKDNWHHAAGILGQEYTVVTLDARNHGRSFHDHEMNYNIMADDLCGLMHHLGHASAIIMGHSMGGKTAMTFAAKYPEKTEKLIVVDISMRGYPPGHIPYFQAFETIDFMAIQSRGEAEEALKPFAPDMTVRQFLLKNLEPLPGGGYQPRFNLPAIKQFYEESIGSLSLPDSCYKGKTLFIAGDRSGYIKEDDKPRILQSFISAHFTTISNAGHWVHADNPSEFITVVQQFLKS
jgi:esterase